MTEGTAEPASEPRFVMSPAFIRWRYLVDRLATVGVTVGGIGVIGAVVLIFFYLAYVVLPLFKPASMEELKVFPVPGGAGPTLYLSVEEQGELGLRITEAGDRVFFRLEDGSILRNDPLPFAPQAVTTIDGTRGLVAALSREGGLHIFRHRHPIHYPEGGGRQIRARIEHPYGEDAVDVDLGTPRQLLVRADDTQLSAAGLGDDGVIRVQRFSVESSFFDDSLSLEELASTTVSPPFRVDRILMDPLQEWLFAIDDAGARLAYYDLRRMPEVSLTETVKLAISGRVDAAAILAGGISLVVATSDGRITQWFPLRDARGDYRLQRVRDFRSPGKSAVTALIPEAQRRGFVAVDGDGRTAVYYATSERRVMQEQVASAALTGGVISPRANLLVLLDQTDQMRIWALHNEHPEISWKALWGDIWYESYSEPAKIWQSSSASGDFEPKLSLSPLSFGTLKAAFYAMLFAVPLAIAGAIFTAYFMSPGMRQIVKPTIEVMEALPTVILGFLAGLWLAPFVESNLPGVFLTLLLLPLTMPITGWAWTRVPPHLRLRVPPGWQPALLIVPLLVAGGLAIALSRPLELALFDGSMPYWLDSVGITFDQRNSLVVGLAMGFAVIPTIFSIAEDAIFSVPKQLTQGSLALGATTWQTLVRVVLPTASPGIFSALMIGFGRAVGETMIVLMATGNTPIMNFNIFEGFRTLSANIAVEMPESEVGSTHFRVLFLAGLVLFLFTFVFNTVAEIVRQRLRRKYSSL